MSLQLPLSPPVYPDLPPLVIAVCHVQPLTPLLFSHATCVGAENDTQAPVDEGWEAAKVEKEDTELLISTYEGALGDLNDAMDRNVDDLARLTEDYATLSLSGPFSAHMEKATGLLEHQYKDMERKGVSKEQLSRMQDSVDLTKRKLELVKMAEEKALREM